MFGIVAAPDMLAVMAECLGTKPLRRASRRKRALALSMVNKHTTKNMKDPEDRMFVCKMFCFRTSTKVQWATNYRHVSGARCAIELRTKRGMHVAVSSRRGLPHSRLRPVPAGEQEPAAKNRSHSSQENGGHTTRNAEPRGGGGAHRTAPFATTSMRAEMSRPPSVHAGPHAAATPQRPMATPPGAEKARLATVARRSALGVLARASAGARREQGGCGSTCASTVTTMKGYSHSVQGAVAALSWDSTMQDNTVGGYVRTICPAATCVNADRSMLPLVCPSAVMSRVSHEICKCSRADELLEPQEVTEQGLLGWGLHTIDTECAEYRHVSGARSER